MRLRLFAMLRRLLSRIGRMRILDSPPSSSDEPMSRDHEQDVDNRLRFLEHEARVLTRLYRQ